MFQIIQNNEVVALCEKPNWVYRQANGYFRECYMQDATGIVANGTVFHIDGRDAIEGVETAVVRDVSAVYSRYLELKAILVEHDYIGVKIATGRATIEEYASEIANMNTWAAEINELQDILKDPNGTLPGVDVVTINAEIPEDLFAEDYEDEPEDEPEDDEFFEDDEDII